MKDFFDMSVIGQPRYDDQPVAGGRFHRERDAHLREAALLAGGVGSGPASSRRRQGLLLQPPLQARSFVICKDAALALD